MSIVGDVIAGFGLAIALVAVIISIVRTRKISPKIELCIVNEINRKNKT